jgi:hypothetical protein
MVHGTWDPVVSGETDLAAMLATLEVVRVPGVFVYVTVPDGQELPRSMRPWATVVEPEGLSVVVGRPQADDAGLEYSFEAAWLTLRVHSSLAAVGLTAALSGALAAAGMPANVIAGHHHDHVLVPLDRWEEAVEVLHSLRQGRGR